MFYVIVAVKNQMGFCVQLYAQTNLKLSVHFQEESCKIIFMKNMLKTPPFLGEKYK